MKTCTRCGNSKPREEFYVNDRYADGFTSWCRRCFTEQRTAKRREKMLADPDFREAERARNRAYRRKYGYSHTDDPKKVQARSAVSNALKDGRISPLDACEDCGHDFSEFRREAHHEDYDKPLDVEWLCSLCHGKRHRRAA